MGKKKKKRKTKGEREQKVSKENGILLSSPSFLDGREGRKERFSNGENRLLPAGYIDPLEQGRRVDPRIKRRNNVEQTSRSGREKVTKDEWRGRVEKR